MRPQESQDASAGGRPPFHAQVIDNAAQEVDRKGSNYQQRKFHAQHATVGVQAASLCDDLPTTRGRRRLQADFGADFDDLFKDFANDDMFKDLF